MEYYKIKLLLVAILIFVSFPAILYSQDDIITYNGDYIEGDIIGVPAHAPNQNTIYLMNMGAGEPGTPEQQWVTVDVSNQVPSGTKAIFVTVMIAITHGQTPETCGMYLYLRRYGEVEQWGVSAKSVIVDMGGGERAGYSHWIALNDGRFELRWYRSTAGVWPAHCSYGFNIWLEGYLRDSQAVSQGVIEYFNPVVGK